LPCTSAAGHPCYHISSSTKTLTLHTIVPGKSARLLPLLLLLLLLLLHLLLLLLLLNLLLLSS